jgi:tetratricopeptide (TPR) repeat protein
VEASFNIASCYASLQQYDQAEKYYLRTIQLDPNFKNTYQSLSGLYAMEHKEKEIIELNQNAINKGIRYDGLYINIGNVYYMAGDTAKALPYLEKAIELNANNKNLNSFLAQYYQNKGNSVKASHYFELSKTGN